MRVVVGTLCEDLRSMARMLNCTVIVLGALNRASGYDNTNIMSGGKESGDIEYSADVIIGLAKEPEVVELKAGKNAKPTREVPIGFEAVNAFIAKNRVGIPETMVPLNWRGMYQEFTGANNEQY